MDVDVDVVDVLLCNLLLKLSLLLLLVLILLLLLLSLLSLLPLLSLLLLLLLLLILGREEEEEEEEEERVPQARGVSPNPPSSEILSRNSANVCLFSTTLSLEVEDLARETVSSIGLFEPSYLQRTCTGVARYPLHSLNLKEKAVDKLVK